MQKPGSSNLLYAPIAFIIAIVIINISISSTLSPANYPDTETYELPVFEIPFRG